MTALVSLLTTSGPESGEVVTHIMHAALSGISPRVDELNPIEIEKYRALAGVHDILKNKHYDILPLSLNGIMYQP